MESWDILVVGAGIAGASAAAELAAGHRVLLIEREEQPGYHTTGRSAALFLEAYGPPAVRALTAASRAFLERPPPGFADHAILSPRGALTIARADQQAALEAKIEEHAQTGLALRRLTGAAAERLVPILRPGHVAAAALEPDAADIDVHALHHGYLRLLRARGGTLLTRAGLLGLSRRDGVWRAETAAGPLSAPLLVNAAGAWADGVAVMAGAAPLGLLPLRRTAIMLDAGPGQRPELWPVVDDAGHAFYIKPEGGRLLASPADETPMPPCDVQPDEEDVAIAVDRIERATSLTVRHIGHRWAGLRTFAPDRSLVIGWDGRVEGLAWLAGQGGYGIQTAPAAALALAAVIAGTDLPRDLLDRGLRAAALSPRRFGSS